MRQLATGITQNLGNRNRKKDRTAVRFSSVLWIFSVHRTEPANTNLDIHGRSFQEEGILVSSWRAHNEEYYGSEDLTGAEGGHQGSQAAIHLEKNRYGEPILPDPSNPPVKAARDVRIWRLNVLRSFVNQHYSEPISRYFHSLNFFSA
jgi:hypothetical protein